MQVFCSLFPLCTLLLFSGKSLYFKEENECTRRNIFWSDKSNAIALQKKCFYTIRAMLFQLKSIALTFHLHPTYIIRCGVWGCQLAISDKNLMRTKRNSSSSKLPSNSSNAVSMQSVWLSLK